MSELVRTAIDATGTVARLVFNRPHVRNAIDVPMAEAFRDAVFGVLAIARIRCIVLAGEGRGFVAGGDLRTFASNFETADREVDLLLDALHPAILALRHSDVAVLAAIHGSTAGAGLSLALAADFVIAAESSQILLAYDKVGAAPDCGGTWFLQRKIGAARALDLMLSERNLTAHEAESLGLVDRVVADDEFNQGVHEMAERLSRLPSAALGSFRRLLDQAAGNTLARQMECEREAFKRATKTADFREGVSAVLEKRPPVFQGR
jgi:2-(1,2-epoxy-1,2-dihydrophenyl)acetyl-CoA isomerase